MRPVMNGFISYSHDDYRVFGTFKIHLKDVERAFGVRFWSDDRINAGYHWDPAILREIEAADICVLLVSPAFIASDYIYDREIPAIRQRKRSAGTLVVPVILQRCSWQFVSGALQAVPTDEGRLKPVADWRPQANGFDRACQQIAQTLQSYYRLSPDTIDWPLS
jgi:hypothetical protein